jgi:predicted ArsR family transcriptional regulator
MLIYLNSDTRRCVKEIAKELEIAEDAASKHLQILSDAGWVVKIAHGRYIYYALDRESLLLNEALTYAREKSIDRLMFMVTALTHERRIRIVRALASEPMSLDRLCSRIKVPAMAVDRHLDKLERRGFVRVENGIWMMILTDEALVKQLIESAASNITPAQV